MKNRIFNICTHFSWQASLKRVEQISGFVVSVGLKTEDVMETAAINFALVPVIVILSE